MFAQHLARHAGFRQLHAQHRTALLALAAINFSRLTVN